MNPKNAHGMLLQAERDARRQAEAFPEQDGQSQSLPRVD
jgi:hypothetical protein